MEQKMDANISRTVKRGRPVRRSLKTVKMSKNLERELCSILTLTKKWSLRINSCTVKEK